MDKTISNKLDTFFTQYKNQKYKKGEIIIRADNEPSGIFYLKSGTVRQYTISRDGEEQTLNIYKPPSFFPMMWALHPVANSYYFEAATDIEVRRAPKDDVLAFIKGEPDILFDLLTRVYSGMHGLLSRMEYLLFNNAYNKIIYSLINNAHRFGEKKENGDIELRFNHKDIAAFSGLTKETISREIKKIESKGLVKTHNHLFVIQSIVKLEEELWG